MDISSTYIFKKGKCKESPEYPMVVRARFNRRYAAAVAKWGRGGIKPQVEDCKGSPEPTKLAFVEVAQGHHSHGIVYTKGRLLHKY